jgi:hypothetical protein
VSRAAGETETTQENSIDWLELFEGDPGCQLLTEKEIATVIFFYLLSPPLHFPFMCFLSFLSFRAIRCFINPDYRLIQMTSPEINPDYRDLM